VEYVRNVLRLLKTGEAIAPLQRVIALDPNISKVYQMLATAQLKLVPAERYAEAEVFFG